MARKGSKFTNYSYEFKLMVVEDYLTGDCGGFGPTAKKYGLKSKTQVHDWVKKYQEDPELLAIDSRGTRSTGRPKTKEIVIKHIEDSEIEEVENPFSDTLEELMNKIEK